MIDLANEVIKETYRADCRLPSPTVRNRIEAARRFILDADMSEMLGRVSVAPYRIVPKKRGDVLISQRRSARLPFDSIFVQYDGKAFRRGLFAEQGDSKDLWGQELLSDKDPQLDIIDPVGWLMERTPKGDLVVVTQYVLNEQRAVTFPFGWVYCTGDEDLGAANVAVKGTPLVLDGPAGQLAHGVTGINDKGCAVLYFNKRGKDGLHPSELLEVKSSDGTLLFQTHYLVAELGGTLRYMYAFLNLLNEVPVSYERARRTQAYLANGKRRATVDTELVRLILPNRTITYRDYARALIKGVIRRAAHQVRGHWRVYGTHHCGEYPQHDWGPTDPTGHADCTRCTASRTWIKNYETKGPTQPIPKVYSVGAR